VILEIEGGFAIREQTLRGKNPGREIEEIYPQMKARRGRGIEEIYLRRKARKEEKSRKSIRR
jgi:hypothetical protein